MLTPEDIRTRSFLVSLRGYDREEVSSFLDEVAALVEQLQSGDAPVRPSDQPAQPVAQATEPSELFAQIGQETQRILEAAQQAGEELRRKAQEETEALRQQVETETAELRGRTESETAELRERTESEAAELRQRTESETAQLRESTEAEVAEQRRNAEAETAELRRRTEEETQAVRAQAEQEAEQLREQAKAEAEREVKDARARATKLIADGERRREAMEREMAELVQTRERTVEQLREIGRTLERTLRSSGAQEETTSSVREALEDAAREDAEGEQQTGPTEDAEHVEVAEPRTEGEPDEEQGTEVESRVAAVADGPEGEHFARRTTALSTLQPKLVRKLKRGLQDLQNGTLDRLRREDGRGDVEQFLPDEAAVRSLGVLAEEHLLAAHGAGVLAAEEAIGREVDLGPTDRELHTPLVDDLEPALVGNLRGTLMEGLEREEDLAALGERVDAVFTDLKSGIVDEASVVSLLSAFELGTYDAWRTAGVAARRYVVCGEPRCDDGRCAENAEAGPVPLDQPFPSGDDAPPMGVGCHCTTMPVLESTS